MAGITGVKWAIRSKEKKTLTGQQYLKKLERRDRMWRILSVPLFPFMLIYKLYKWTYEDWEKG